MKRTSVMAIVALSLGALAPGRAFAQDASNQAAAQALFEQARQLMADGKFAEACPKLVESERLDPGAGTLMNLGHCYEKNGQTASAWVTFKDAAAAADLKHRADWSSRARERAQALEPMLSRLTIEVPPDARISGLQVRRDGVEVGAAVWGTPIPIDPGDHAIEASAPAKKTWSKTTKIGAAAEQAHVVVPSLQDEPGPSGASASVASTPATPVKAPAAPPPASSTPPPAESRSDGSTQRTLGLVIGGVGIAGVAVGSVFGILAMGSESSSKNLCPTDACTSPTAVQDDANARTQATVSTVAMIAGGAVLVTGAVIFFTAPKGKTVTGLRVMPAVGAGEVGLRLGGAW
jgi:hypothetical protein